MTRILTLVLALSLAACGTVNLPQLTVIHQQATAKLKADFLGVKAVAAASGNQQLSDCADAVLSDQLPPIEALDSVQVTGIFSALALADAKAAALKIKPSVAVRCSAQGWLLGQLGLLGK